VVLPAGYFDDPSVKSTNNEQDNNTEKPVFYQQYDSLNSLTMQINFH
jgi:hypothetical protein